MNTNQPAAADQAIVPNTPAPVATNQVESSTATDCAEDSRFRVTNEEDNSLSEGSTATLGSTKSAFLKARDIPGEEMKSALAWRVNALRGQMNEVSVKDADMVDAEGEPASDVGVERN